MHGSGILKERRTNVDADKKHIRFICRVACLASLAEPPTQWKGPVSKAFLVSNSMVAEVSKNLRNLVEMVVLAMCIHGDVDRLGRHTFEWSKIGLMYFPLSMGS